MKNTLLKKTSIAAAVAAFMFSAGAAQAAIVELAVNGDFATGDSTGWTFFVNGGTMDYSHTSFSMRGSYTCFSI